MHRQGEREGRLPLFVPNHAGRRPTQRLGWLALFARRQAGCSPWLIRCDPNFETKPIRELEQPQAHLVEITCAVCGCVFLAQSHDVAVDKSIGGDAGRHQGRIRCDQAWKRRGDLGL